jgi:hypothetical protein
VRRLPGLLALSISLCTSAQATDLSGTLSEYLRQKVPPTKTLLMDPKENPVAFVKAQVLTWEQPQRLKADQLAFIYLYGLGPDFWAAYIKNPRSPLSDYLGTQKITLAGKRSVSPTLTMNVYRVDGGPYKGFLAQYGINHDGSLLVLMPAKAAASSPTTAQYLK